jgi:uncharacterized protein
MPPVLTHPGVYVEEIPSGVRPITGVSTSNTAFVDFFAEGPYEEPWRVDSFEEFTRRFGGLDRRSAASYGVLQFFVNGGSVAFILRTAADADQGNNIPAPAPASFVFEGGSPLEDILQIDGANPGVWGRQVQVGVEAVAGDGAVFNLVARRVRTVQGRATVVESEVHRNLTMTVGTPRYAINVINNSSRLVHATNAAQNPGANTLPVLGAAESLSGPAVLVNPGAAGFTALQNGDDGVPPDGNKLATILRRLDAIAPQVFNLLCVPRMAELDGDAATPTPNAATLIGAATTFCRERRAFLLVDPPVGVDDRADMEQWINENGATRDRNSAIFFPRLELPDPLDENRLRPVAASGTMAGIYARTDAERGIWKAPAGTEARMRGASIVGAPLTDADSGVLNPMGVNVLRSMPVFGDIVWGARTTDGAEQLASEWKYVPVRRTALYIEESLFQGLRWVVFEPNDEPLWAQIRLNVGAFMHSLFRKGAFQGITPRQAYMVRCDNRTTTQPDIDAGVVNILVGFAPLKPAEFVVIQIQQMTAQATT